MPWAGLYRYWLFAKVTDALRRGVCVPRETRPEAVSVTDVMPPEVIFLEPHPWLTLEPWRCSIWVGATASRPPFVSRETIRLSEKEKRNFKLKLLCAWIFKLLQPPIGF